MSGLDKNHVRVWWAKELSKLSIPTYWTRIAHLFANGEEKRSEAFALLMASRKETAILYWEESPEFAVRSVKIGDIARDFDRGAILGKVTDIQIDDSISFVKTADGRVVASSTPGYVSYHITLEATGVPSDLGGVIFDGMDYQIGKSMTVKVGNAIFMGRIDRLEKKG